MGVFENKEKDIVLDIISTGTIIVVFIMLAMMKYSNANSNDARDVTDSQTNLVSTVEK